MLRIKNYLPLLNFTPFPSVNLFHWNKEAMDTAKGKLRDNRPEPDKDAQGRASSDLILG